MAIKLSHIAGAQRLSKKATTEGLSVLGIGARQGGQDPTGRPCGDTTLQDGIEEILRKGLHEGNSPADPTQVPADSPGDIAQRATETALKLFNQCGLLDGVEVALLGAGKDPDEGLIFLTGPDLGQYRVAAQPPQGFHA